MNYTFINPGTYLTWVEAEYVVSSPWYGLYTLWEMQLAGKTYIHCIDIADKLTSPDT